MHKKKIELVSFVHNNRKSKYSPDYWNLLFGDKIGTNECNLKLDVKRK